MRILVALIVFISASVPSAAATLFPALEDEGAVQTLTVYSSLDENVAPPLIRAFQAANPDIAVSYHDMQTLEIYERVIRETDAGDRTADLVISSAMDLQLKLVNDGYAMRLPEIDTDDWPDWASWRQSAFGLTFEPSVIVYHKPSFETLPLPENRADLIDLLRDNDDLYGRIGTYDVERSGLGFLFLARDLEHNRDIWDLVSAFGAAGVKLYSNSSAILDRVADGRFALGYNILGSYARGWADRVPELGVILPKDYTVVMSRIAFVPEAAANPDLGRRMLSFLMSVPGQTIMASDLQLPVLNPAVEGENTARAMRERHGRQLRPISISPGLVVYLDQVKRARFISRWNEALRTK